MGFHVAAQARVTGRGGLYGQGGDAVRVQALFMDGDLVATLRVQRDRALRVVDEITESTFRSEDPYAVVARLYEQFWMEPVALTEGAISVEAHDADVDLRRLRDMLAMLIAGFEVPHRPHRRCEARGLSTTSHTPANKSSSS